MFFNLFLYLDYPLNWQFGFQDSATPIAEGLNELHNYINIIIINWVYYYIVYILLLLYP